MKTQICKGCSERPADYPGVRLCSRCYKRQWRQRGGEAVERDRAGARDYKRRQKRACRECGALMGWDSSGELCLLCLHEAAYGERNRRIVVAWNNGKTAVEIGAVEGLSSRLITTLVDHWRRRGTYDVLRHHRSHREAWDYIERRWNKGGATTSELAVELETTPANVGMMIKSMRAAGVHVAYRRTRVAA